MTKRALKKGVTLAPATTFTPVFSTAREAAKEFKLLLVDFSVGELSQQASRQKDTVKKWKAGDAFPDGTSLLNLLLNNKVIRGRILSMLGIREMPDFIDDRILTAAMAAAYQVSHENNPTADEVRAAFQRHRK